MKPFVVVVILFFAGTANASDLAPFTTDGCSRFPDGTLSEPDLWLECCTVHDVAYWQGGTDEQRSVADLELRQCVSGLGRPTIALLMFVGVRIGGTPYVPTSFRWGYGWPYFRDYGALREFERAAVEKALKDAGKHR